MAPRRSTPKGHAARASRRLQHESLEKRELLASDIAGPQLISVSANSGENFNLLGTNELKVAPQQLTFRFSGGQEINPSTLSAIRIVGSGGDGDFTNGNERVVSPGFIGLGDSTRIVIARFSSDLPDDQYRISISGFDQTDQGQVSLRNTLGERFQPTNPPNAASPSEEVFFNVEVGARVVAVVPQPIVGTGAARTQNRDQVYVYFNNDPLTNPGAGVVTSTGVPTDPTVVQPRFYNLFVTRDTVESGDDGPAIQPTSITYDPSLRRAVLTFASDLSAIPAVAATGGSATLRLRVGSSQSLPVTLAPFSGDLSGDVGQLFSSAQSIAGAGFGGGSDASIVVSGQISPTAGNSIQWPGIDSPGLRDDRRDAQVTGRADTIDGVNVYFYNFASAYGLDNSTPPQVLNNAITPAQKQRAREVLDLYSRQLGVQFVETENRGLQIVTGDLRPLVETATTGPGLPFQEYRVNDADPTQGVLILDSGETWFDGYGLSPDPSQPSWFTEALRGIGNLLGIGSTFEQVPGVASGSNPALYTAAQFGNPAGFTIEPDFLSTSDIVPGQALHRPEIRDADLYQFSVTERGRISIETFAQRRLDSSMLDTDLKLWRQNPTTLKFELVARNADFYGNDSFIGVDVDRNSNGSNAVYVIGVTAAGNDDYNPDVVGSGGGGRSQGRYDMQISFESSTVGTILDTNNSRLDGDSDGQQGGDFNFWFRTAKTKGGTSPALAGEVRTLFVDSTNGVDSVASGTLASPYRTIGYAIAQSEAYATAQRPGASTQDIIRLLADGGVDGLINTTADNLAYEIGTGGSGNLPLKDGQTLEVPKGVTVMIDAGAILKLRNAKISVGSESIDKDRSLAALQVLGAPFIVDQNGATIDGTVDITSYNEERRNGVLLGLDNNAIPTTAGPGDWAGIEFRNDVDYSEGRGVWETEGIFLDYVSHADIRFGGGSVTLTELPVAPLQMSDSRPTLIYNHISDSSSAALTADPNSFQETNFNAPRFQQASIAKFGTTFTSDYDRVGPLIRGNSVERNSVNGLFVRVETPAVDVRKPLTTSARFDDRDIAHVFSEVLVLQGNPGGPLALEQRPDVLNITVNAGSAFPAPGTPLTAGRVVDYRLTFVTVDGLESLASQPTRSFTVSSSGAVNLSNLPAAPNEYAGRRLYRLTPNGEYEFVTQLDRATSSYRDNGTTRGGRLSLASIPESSLVALNSPIGSASGTLNVGAVHNYRFTFVTADGRESSSDAATGNVTVQSSGTVVLGNASSSSTTKLPPVPAEFVGLNVYRNLGSDFVLVATLPAGTNLFPDVGTTSPAGELFSSQPIGSAGGEKLLPRLNARLSVDPGLVLKLDTARIEATFGADFYAEGTDGNPVVFTSRRDDRFGAGGTFDTNNDGFHDQFDPLGPKPGNWSGLVFRQGSSGSIDNAVISFAGGESSVGGNFAYFNPIEILQADVRVAHSIISDNASGTLLGTTDYDTRDGAGFNGPATIFVRGAQPVIVDNIITDNIGAAISVNPDALNYLSVRDLGRGTGQIDRFVGDADNQGPLVEANRLDRNSINGMLVRNESLTTESVWDDTDVVHVVEHSVYAWNNHQRSGLRLKSDANQSLVVKVQAGGSLNADRYRNDIEDSIGGTIQVLGQPGFPVVLTSINDCSVGAGFTPDGLPQNDTVESGACSSIIVQPQNAPYVDVIIVMDETVTMRQTQVFTGQLILDLEAALLAQGIGSTSAGGNRYGAVGFGSGFGFGGPGGGGGGGTPGADELGRQILIGAGGTTQYGTAAEYAAASTTAFLSNGAREDGYAAIDFALQNYSTRTDAAKFIIFASDEDRDILVPSLTVNSTISNLQSRGFNFQAIVGVNIANNAGQQALAIDNNNVFTINGGTFASAPGGAITGGFGTTTADYVSIVNATGGIAGDIRQIATSAATANVFSQVLVTSIIGQVSGGQNPAAAGDWEGIVINPGSNDRNVAFIAEAERAIGTASGVNAVPGIAQILGSLARNEVSADENRRLGFNVRGALSQNSDIDVYRFAANGGTEVYIDIDDTDFGLDTIVEVIDVNGNIQALSNNSNAESNTPSQLFRAPTMPTGSVLPLFKTGQKVVETPNSLDAGMRVILTGNSSTVNDYYVRVRSSNLKTGDPTSNLTSTALVGAGLSSGQYQLSIRLRETDEIAGTTVRLADIRFATTAIDIPAAPNNSPLAAEHAEELTETGLDLNDSGTAFNGGVGTASFNNSDADPLGSLNSSERGALRVSGVLGNQIATTNPQFGFLSELDIDVYRVDIRSDSLGPNIIGENRFVSTVFDIDYADQLGRANTSIAVYDAAGRVILHSRDSNIAEDQGRPTQGNDQTNLSAGSSGTLDAFIGPVELQVGTYYVVVSSSQMIPESLNQFFAATPSDTNVRVLPIDSVRNIAEEGFSETVLGTPAQGTTTTTLFTEQQQLNTTADLPTITPFFDASSVVPYKLEDVRLFLTLNQGLSGTNRSTLITVDPFTGQLERTIGQFAQPTGDLAIRRDGELFAYSLGPATGAQDNGNTGNFLNISSADASTSSPGDDGLSFVRNNQAGTGTEAADPEQALYNALAFAPLTGTLGGSPTAASTAIGDGERAFAVGNREGIGRGEIPFALTQNVLYSMVANNGAATNRGSTAANTDRNFGNGPYAEFFGPASNKFELGVIDTGQFPDSEVDPATGLIIDGGVITGLAVDPQNTQNFFAVTDNGYVYSFSQFSQRSVDVDPGFGSYSSVINTTNHGQITPHPDDFTSVFNGGVQFSSMTLGPRLTERGVGATLGPYARTLFGVTAQGWIYTMNVNTATGKVEPAHVLFNGNYAIPITSAFGGTLGISPVGAAFSTREENLWHQTNDRNTPFSTGTPNSQDNQHGVFIPHNQTRQRISGGTSLYFGVEIDGNAANNTLDGGNGTLNPGGVHGSTVSKPFSLEGYNAGDKPTLYFNYFLEVEANDDYRLGNLIANQQVDSFRVFATGDDGQWRLVSTNNSFREFVNQDEYDEFLLNNGIPVQELFDDNGVWRQARVDLAPLAGHKNVQIRFDFSTAGGMQSQFTFGNGYLTEVQATAGTDVIPGSTFTMSDSTFNSTPKTFEFVRGAAVQIPAGAAIPEGQQLRFTNALGLSTTITLTTDPLSVAVNSLLFARTDSAATIATSIASTLNTLDPTLVASATGADLRVVEAASFAATPARFSGSALTVPDADASLVGKSLQFANLLGSTTAITFETSQQVRFGTGAESITVTSDIAGNADGVSFLFVDRFDPLNLFPVADAVASASFNATTRVITVTYNSNPDPLLITPTFNDYAAVTAAINGLFNFSASLSSGVATSRFASPATGVVFSSTEVYFDPLTTTGDVLAQSIATKLNALDSSLAATVVGNTLTLGGVSSVPITIPVDVASIDGQTLSFTNAAGTTTTLTLTTAPPTGFTQVQYALTNTPDEIATLVANRLALFSPTLGASSVRDQVIVTGATTLTLGPAFTLATINPTTFNVGTTASQYLPSGNVPIFYTESMSMVSVRDAIRTAFVNGLGNISPASGVSTATIANFPEYGTNRIRVFNWSQLTVNNTSLGFSNFLPGDEFGAFGSQSISTNQINTRPGSNNNIEGVYIDDIVIGFAERGEVVLNAPINQNFDVLPEQRTFSFLNSQQPEFPNEILVGSYTLEVRTGTEYGVPEDYDPIRLGLNEQFGFGRSFDTNDRLDGEAVTLIAPRGNDLIDGDTFVISNGSQQLTFEFDSNGNVQTGRVRVPFTAAGSGANFSSNSDEETSVARSIRDAINSAQAFGVLGIYAAGRDSSDFGVMTGNRVELFGKSIQVNPSSGRFMKVDLVKEETFYGRESARTLPIVDHTNQTVQDLFFYDTFARATVTDYVNGATDTLVATGKVGDHVATDDANVLIPDSPANDVDVVKIFLNAGDTIDVDLDTVGWALGSQLDLSNRVGIPLNVTSLDGQSVTVANSSGQITTVTLTLGFPTNANQVRFFASDTQQFVAFRLANRLQTLDPTLGATFSLTDLIITNGEVISSGPAFTKASGSLLQIFDNTGSLLTNSSLFSATAPGERNRGAWIDNFVAPTSGYYFVSVGTAQLASSFLLNSGFGEYQLTVRPGSAVPRDVIMVDYHLERGDANRFRDQGQYIIESNFIRDFANVGINATFNTGQADNDANFSSVPIDRRPGAAVTLRNPNTERMLPGTVISNNVVIASTGTAIVYSGETAAGGNSPAPVPFGRIVNNTVVGDGGGVGISVAQSASPTVLNNIITGFGTGVNISADSSSTVEGGNAYQNNGNNASRPIAASSIVIANATALFQDSANGVYIPAINSAVIDSSFASLADRTTFVNTVKGPVGLATSPIIGPRFDAYGIPRFDDPNVTTPSGVGGNTFIDRGAIDRADFVRPIADLAAPLDFVPGGVSVTGGDIDPSKSFVRLTSGSVRFFEIQLFDPSGSGPDPRSITQDSVILTENGIRLLPGVDYTFGYSDNSRLARLTPLGGLWRTDAVYDITLNNQNRFGLDLPAGDAINDGDRYTVTDSVGRSSVLEFDSGNVLRIPQTLGIQVTGPNTTFVDGDTFTISVTDALGVVQQTRTFEINRAGTVRAGNIPVNIGSPNDGSGGPFTSVGPTIQSVRDAILAALNNPAASVLNLAPRALGSEQLQIGSLDGYSITGSVTGLDFFGVASGVVPGDQFRYTVAGGTTELFEFTSGPTPVVSSSARPIQISRTDTVDEIAVKVAAAVVATPLGLTGARSIDDGRVLLGGAPNDTLTVIQASVFPPAFVATNNLQVVGRAGVTGKLTITVPLGTTAVSLEGSRFTVRNGSELETFQLTSLTPPPATTDRLINLTSSDSEALIAQKIAATIDAGIVSLAPSANINVVSLNERDATAPVQVLASIVATGTPLVVNGVSGGAIPVPFVPTSNFSPQSSATSFVTAIQRSPLGVSSFSPGGGTLLFTGVQGITLTRPSGATTDVGASIPAIADLAQNAVASNRDNSETRFTIIMPEVRFDFGDAPNSFGTLLASDGARHAIVGSSTLRLGQFLDGENDATAFPNSDDAEVNVTVTSSNPSAITVNSLLVTNPTLSVISVPSSRDTVTVAVGTRSTTFEFVRSTENPSTGRVGVIYAPGEPLTSITQKLLSAVRADFATTAVGGVFFSIDPSSSTTISILAIDDEDGVSTGLFTPPLATPLRVFTRFGATSPISATDVTGFINPLDPAGTNFQVAVSGSGLLDVFVDFNRDGDFNDPGEKAVSNAAVTDGVNTLTLFAPSNASQGDTWIRLRLSEGGNLGPNGVAIGGEVEDYQISIRSIAPAVPVMDVYNIVEDQVINTSIDATRPALADNDQNLATQLITPSVFLVTQPANGTVTITNPATGDFIYTPNADFNGVDTFTYRLGTQPTASAASLAVATLGTVTVNVSAVNDAPTFTVNSVNNLLEDSGVGSPRSVTINGVVSNVLPGPATALDEMAGQTVVLAINTGASNVPPGLMSQPAIISQSGDLTVFPATDAYGTAIYAVTITDSGSPIGVSTALVTVNVRPVNDAPRADQSRLGETNNAGPDNVYTVASGSNPDIAAGTLIYTFKEDGGPYFLPLRQASSGLSFSRIGLLDPLLAGPANETQVHEGGPQQLLLSSIGGVAVGASSVTGANGTLTPVFATSGTLIGYDYTPPVDLNSDIASFDEFSYVVVDQNGSNPLDPEGYTDPNGVPVNGPLTATNRVILILNPVNDTPLFTLPETLVTVPEDAATFTQDNFAINIFAGPQLSAFDEVDVTTGQNVTFSVTSITFPQNQSSQFFTQFPTVSPEGTLQFQPAPDVFGQFQFEVVLTDDGPDNSTRGDDISSDPVTITINVLPVNDAPARVPGVNNLAYSVVEDGSFDVPTQGPLTAPGLLNLFNVGPTNEANTNIPRLSGGSQVLTLDQLPASTTNGGTLTPVTNQSGQLVSLRYRPRANYVGPDSFIYSVIDNGVTISVDGQTLSDPRRAFATVSFTVTPVNDAPLFSGGSSVVSQEDPTPATTTITNWVTNVQAGPLGANDESNQVLTFEFTQIGGPTDLLTTGPTATIVGGNANLTYTSAPDANGLLTFTVRLRDNGAAGQGNINVSPAQTFTIRVNPVNDPPSFVPGANVTVQEDSGAYRETWATSVSPGPADEQAVPQTVSFDVTTDTASQTLFQTLPTIGSDGVLQFIPAANASGVATVNVVARDSAGEVSSSVTLQIIIEEVNDAPTAVSNSVTTDEDRVLTINASQLLANDTDPDLATNPNEVLSVVLPAQQFSVSGALVSYNSLTGVITYDPTRSDAIQSLAPGQTLTDSFAYRVRDFDGLESAPVTVSLRVDGINDAPRLVADNPTLNPNGSTTIRPLDNDSDVDGTINPASLTITLQPAFGSLTITPGGVLTYTPFSTFSGEDVFRYTVADNLGQQSPEATVVVSSNAAPTAANDAGGTFREEDVLINVAANDRDFDGTLNLASIEIVRQPTRGEAIPQSDGTVRYVPGLGFTGLDSFTYTIADNEGRRSQSATVQLQVVGSRLQNPAFDRNSDVSDDGLITAVDALLVINRLNAAQNDGTLVNGGVPVTDADRGPFYYDVNGDGRITAADALEVLRILNLRDALGQGGTSASGEGEFIVASDTLSPTRVSTSEQAAEPVAITLWEDGKVRIDSFVSDDDLTSLAISMSDNDTDSTQTNENAIDAVLRLFS